MLTCELVDTQRPEISYKVPDKDVSPCTFNVIVVVNRCYVYAVQVKSDDVELAGNIMMCGMGVCEAAGKNGCENTERSQQPGFTVSDCQYKCCSEDLCNDASLYSSAGRGVASFGAIFAAFLLSRFLI